MYLCNKFVIGTRGNLQYFCYINSVMYITYKTYFGKNFIGLYIGSFHFYVNQNRFKICAKFLNQNSQKPYYCTSYIFYRKSKSLYH